MVLLLSLGAAVAVFGSFTTLLEQVLCVQGYTSVRAHEPRVWARTYQQKAHEVDEVIERALKCRRLPFGC